jgi:hypothetical protein
VSVEAISWALNRAPVSADRGGQPSTACKFVLLGLASYAGPDDAGAFPSMATLVRHTGLLERAGAETVREPVLGTVHRVVSHWTVPALRQLHSR